jgi:G3E family GTPase
MHVIIFGGFVGSGKTSLIISLAQFLVRKEPTRNPAVVIIENEIGEVGIDQKVLSSYGLAVKELFSGCICCQLTADLVMTVNNLTEQVGPPWVIVEATGLAYPGKVLDTLKKYGKGIGSMKTVTVVDSQRWEEISTVAPILAETQVADGNVILINKTDLVTEEELQSVENHVVRLNPESGVYRISAAGQIHDDIWEKTELHNG